VTAPLLDSRDRTAVERPQDTKTTRQ